MAAVPEVLPGTTASYPPPTARASVACRTSRVCREGLSDFERNTEGVRVGHIRRHRHDNLVLGDRHERRDHSAQRLPIVADAARVFTGDRNGLEAQPRPYPVSWPEANRWAAWSTWTVAGCSSVPPLIAIPNRTRSEGVDRNALAPA